MPALQTKPRQAASRGGGKGLGTEEGKARAWPEAPRRREFSEVSSAGDAVEHSSASWTGQVQFPRSGGNKRIELEERI